MEGLEAAYSGYGEMDSATGVNWGRMYDDGYEYLRFGSFPQTHLTLPTQPCSSHQHRHDFPQMSYLKNCKEINAEQANAHTRPEL